jgi:putative radical SAM enzyme (TIGR03279 family)
VIKEVLPESIAEEMEIEPGDVLLAINEQEIKDVFDYRFLIKDEYIEVLIRKADGEEWLLEIDKDFDEDLGIEFENGLMDNYRSCHNKCIFCFIDQMPKGMRETLYFKDDDSRLSFLQGNYVTLTNMSDHDIDRIIRYNLSPINISFQTTNPELRCMMLNNRFAGDALKKVDRLYEAGILMNGQIVLCKGINDGEELERSISDLTKYLPYLESVSVVPVGLSKYREGLYPLEPFTKEDAVKVLDTIHKWQDKLYPEHGLHFIHASDEWYILAGQEIPDEDNYDGYIQYENGVGMLRMLMDEVEEALVFGKERGILPCKKDREISLATGKLANPYIQKFAEQTMALCEGLKIHVYPITNEFFGEMITVSGLITGQDIIKQLKGQSLGEVLYLPENILRSGEDVFLDDLTVGDVQNSLQVPLDIVKSNGYELVSSMLGTDIGALKPAVEED